MQSFCAAALDPIYAVVNGLRVDDRGTEMYLEHLVVSPTGIFLLETAEGDDRAWRQDLVRNLEFFQRALGTQSFYFTCLLICRGVPRDPLPAGAHLVDSLDVALEVIRSRHAGLTLPPALEQELWHLIGAMEMPDSLPKRPVRRGRQDRPVQRDRPVRGSSTTPICPGGKLT